MIERHWKGICKPAAATNYVQHLREDTFKQLNLLPGYVGSKLLRRDTDDGIEFLVITIWGSLKHIRQFSGNDLTLAIVPKLVADMMISYDLRAVHYEVEEGF